MKFARYDLDDLSLPRAECDTALRWLRDNDPLHWDAKVRTSRAVNVPDDFMPFGRFSGDHVWPVLGDHRGLGIVDADLNAFSDWCDGIIEGIGAEPGSERERRSMESAGRMYGHLSDVIAKRRVAPGEDILSTLMQAREEGVFGDDAGLATEELLQFAMLLVMGGNETTRNAISGGVLALFEHPDELERLRADRKLMATAVDEILRWTKSFAR